MSLKTRLVVMTLLFLLLPTGILGFLGYDYLYKHIKDTNIRAVGRIADAQHHHLASILTDTQHRVTDLLTHLEEQCSLKKSPHKQTLCIQSELQKFIINDQAVGAMLSSKTGDSVKTNIFVMNDDDIVFKDQQLAAFSQPNSEGERFYYLAANNAKTGYRLLVMYSLQTMQEIVTIGTDLIGASGDLFILDNQGFFITKPRLLTTKAPNEKENDHVMHHCLAAGNADMLAMDRRNVPIIHSFRFVPEIGGGCIMAHLDQAEAFADLTTLQLRVAIITLLLVVAALIIARLVGRTITKPIDKLCEVTHQIINGNYAVSAVVAGDVEIAALANAFNLMTERLRLAFDELHLHRTQLEEQVVSRTQQLVTAKEHAENSLDLLQKTQENLIQAEKMAALGGLVAGVAHEINTPIGITLTSATFLQAETEKVSSLYAQGELDGDGLTSYFDSSQQFTQLMTINCQRAADLIHSFKQVAVDQTSDNHREFNVKDYLTEVLLSLRPTIKSPLISVQLHCADNLIISGYPGALSQIVTNFLMNSITHAYPEQKTRQGFIHLTINTVADASIELVYSDDGKGIPPELHHKIFEPFFTTQSGNGGSGLGLHIVYNIVYQQLKGSLTMTSAEATGTTFTLCFPQYL